MSIIILSGFSVSVKHPDIPELIEVQAARKFIGSYKVVAKAVHCLKLSHHSLVIQKYFLGLLPFISIWLTYISG